MGEKSESQLDPMAKGLQSKIGDYADVIVRSNEIDEEARRLNELRELAPVINQELDRERYALHVEPPTPGRARLFVLEDDGRWLPWCEMSLQGFPRPFVGDSLVVRDDGTLLVADTARRLAIDSIRKLEIRPKDDESVKEFADEEAVATLRKIGETATTRADTRTTLTRDRWGRDSIEDR